MKSRILLLLICVLFAGKCSCEETCHYEDFSGNQQETRCGDNFHCCSGNRQCCADFWTTAVIAGIVIGAIVIIGGGTTVMAFCIFNVCCKSLGVDGRRVNPAPPPSVSYIATNQQLQYVSSYPQPQGLSTQPLNPLSGPPTKPYPPLGPPTQPLHAPQGPSTQSMHAPSHNNMEQPPPYSDQANYPQMFPSAPQPSTSQLYEKQ